MQKKMSQPLMLQNLVLYSWGICFNGFNWLQSTTKQPAFGALGFYQVASIIFYATYGLSISVIIKEFGSVTRTFVNTAAICCTALLDYFVLGEKVTAHYLFLLLTHHYVLLTTYHLPLNTDYV